MVDIVTGVQNEEASVRVLERALSEAETTGRPLRVVTAWSNPVLVGDMAGFGYTGASIPLSDSERCATELVDTLLAKALTARHSPPPLNTWTEAHMGDPGRVLQEMGNDAGLVVVGDRSHGALATALLGSTTGYVVHHATCPVMVVPASTAPGPFLRVIVGFDGESCSRSALRWGLDAAARHRCPLHVIHAENVLPFPGPNTVYPDHDAALGAWIAEEIDQILPDRRDVQVTHEIIDGPASRVLIGRAGPDDLLVVGSRSRGGFVDLVLGSVATQCTAHARGAVVVVREGQERLPA